MIFFQEDMCCVDYFNQILSFKGALEPLGCIHCKPSKTRKHTKKLVSTQKHFRGSSFKAYAPQKTGKSAHFCLANFVHFGCHRLFSEKNSAMLFLWKLMPIDILLKFFFSWPKVCCTGINVASHFFLLFLLKETSSLLYFSQNGCNLQRRSKFSRYFLKNTNLTEG